MLRLTLADEFAVVKLGVRFADLRKHQELVPSFFVSAVGPTLSAIAVHAISAIGQEQSRCHGHRNPNGHSTQGSIQVARPLATSWSGPTLREREHPIFNQQRVDSFP